MSRLLVRATAIAVVTTSVGLVAAGTGSAFTYVSDSNALRTGASSRTLMFTLSTTTP